jgi:hypothetical protein
MLRIRFAALLAVSVLILALGGGQALASQGSGGGSGGGGSGGGGSGGGGGVTTPPAPAPAPSVSLSPSPVIFGSQAVGTTSVAQTVKLTNTGTTSLFINGVFSAGADQLDFNRTNDLCVGSSVAAGASCTIAIVFNPTATGPRTMSLSIIDNNFNSTQTLNMSGTGTSVNGPTPLSVDTTGLSCTTGVCQLATPGMVKDFYFANLSTLGQATAPFSWTLAGGTLPPGLGLFANGQLYGTPTTTGTFTFTVKVTDAAGQTAIQAFSLNITPPPPPLTAAQQGCQHAPGSTTAALTGAAIAGRAPSGQGIGDQSQLTSCGGFTVIRASVQNVNLPNGTVLWVTLGGEPIGRITLSNGAGTMAPWVTALSLRKVGMGIFTQPPTGTAPQSPILSGPFV